MHVHSAFCLSVEICASELDGRSMSLLFAPFSGLLYMQYRGDSCLMSTPALPALNENVAVLRVWAQVKEDGSIFFLREKGGTVETTGLLPQDALPKWASEYFVCGHIWRAYLPNPLEMTVEHSHEDLPSELLPYVPKEPIETTWQLLS